MNQAGQIAFESAVPKQAAANIAGVLRGAVEIHLWHCADRHIAENTACRINVEGIEAPYAEYRPRGVIHPNGANDMTFSEPA